MESAVVIGHVINQDCRSTTLIMKPQGEQLFVLKMSLTTAPKEVVSKLVSF